MAFGIKVKTIFPFKQGGGQQDEMAQAVSKASDPSSTLVQNTVKAKSPLPISTPVSTSQEGASPIAGLVQDSAAAAPSASGTPAAPPQEDKTKLNKDIMNLFTEEDAAVTPLRELTHGLVEIDMQSIYKECLSCKSMLG